MLSPSRGPERLVRAGQWVIALLFAWFLIQVGTSLIADLPLLTRAPQPSQYQQQAALTQVQGQLQPLREQERQLQEQLGDLERQTNQAEENLRRDRQSFETWRAARTATEQSDQNPEVVARAQKLDGELAQLQRIGERKRQLQQRQSALQQQLAPVAQQLLSLENQDREAFEAARRRHEWTAFLIRLGFVLPVLALAIWLFQRQRGSEQWPFVWGFLLFALFAFFVELVPYLPSFGAYIRYGVGALLTYLGGRALMRWLRAYLSRKQAEQQAPQEQRLQQIRYEKALQTLGRRQCPSCERFISSGDAPLPDYCMHCGLRIKTHCRSCEHHHLAFYPYCPACGTPCDPIDPAEGAAATTVAG